MGQRDRLSLSFTREADTAQAAILVALGQVNRAFPSARLIEAVPDLVGLTDIAALIGVSRQNMRKLMIAHYDGFPVPLHGGRGSLWHLADVLVWLLAKTRHAPDASLLETATALRAINLVKEIHRAPSGMHHTTPAGSWAD